MRTFNIILLLSSLAYCQDSTMDQLATIKSSDGFVNIRLKPDSASEVVALLHPDGIFYFSPENTKGGWSPIEFQTDTAWLPLGERQLILKHFKPDGNNVYIEGYLSESEIQPLSKFPRIEFEKRRETGNSIYLENDSITFFLSSADFNPAKHNLSTINDEQYVDGLKAWGRDWGVPMTEISSIKFTLSGKPVLISKCDYTNLYEPNFREFHFYSGVNGEIFFHMMNSDGGAVYDAVFLIKDGKCKLIFIDLNPYD